MLKKSKAYYEMDYYHKTQSLSREFLYDVKNETQSCVLQNRLISAQCHLNKSLSECISETRNSLQEINYQEGNLQRGENIAKIFNHSILIFIALENYPYAREICYSQIQKFIFFSKKVNSIEPLKNVFKPWMQLIEIDRLEGNIYDAFEKLNILNLEKNAKVILGDNKLLANSLYQALHQDPLLYNEIVNQSVIAKINLSFQSGQYNELISFIEKDGAYWDRPRQPIIQEAQAVAYANSGKTKEALTVLGYRSKTKNPIFVLRELELRIALGFNQWKSETLEYFYQTSKLDMCRLTIHQIVMMLHLAKIMQTNGMIKNAMKIANCCLESANKLGDEVLQAESLMILYDCSEDKKTIEDLMITHFFNTRYAEVRKKMVYCFKDLTFVETKYHYDDAKSLFEELLAFNVT